MLDVTNNFSRVIIVKILLYLVLYACV